MTTHDVRAYLDSRGLLVLWLTVLSGPAAWALNQLIGYALVKPVCSGDAAMKAILIGLSGAALLATVAGGWTAWSFLARLKDANPRGGAPEDRSQMLAISGVALNALLGLLVATNTVAQFLLSPCE